ncbi:hypothetical protein BDW74DRAFT_163435 [Aspergillus multicolor]|uniref:uncharacterized protein n=1 Tax=Aspergillus multicolor TaxID=41759 RepID=UPI003CCD68B5
MRLSLAAIAAFVAASGALLLDTPRRDIELDLGQNNTVTWTPNPSDPDEPATFNLYLTNYDGGHDDNGGNVCQFIATVDTASGRYTILEDSVNAHIPAHPSYRFRAHRYVARCEDAPNTPRPNIITQTDTFPVREYRP